MTSLSSLIYGSQVSTEQEETQNQSPQKQNKSSQPSSVLRETYKYDPLEAYYEGDNNNNNNNSNDANNTKRKADSPNNTNSTKIKRKKYDFQQNEQNREFYNTNKTLSKANRTITKNKGGRQGKQRRVFDEGTDTYIYIDDEAPEEKEARLKKQKDRRDRRYRFRHTKKFDLRGEEDVGDAVDFVVKRSMALKDRIGKRKRKRDSVEVLKSEDTINEYVHDDDNEENEANGEHVLGSLLERVENHDPTVQQARKEQGALLENQSPMRFLKEGRAAPLSRDVEFPYLQKTKILGCIEANESYLNFFQEFYGPIKLEYNGSKNKKTDQDENDSSADVETQTKPQHDNTVIDVKLPSLYMFRKPDRVNGFYNYSSLPLSRYNPVVKRARFKTNNDTYHYLPSTTSSAHIAKKTRMNMAKDHCTLSTLTNCDSKRHAHYKNQYNKPLKFHSNNITRLAARHIVGCSGTRLVLQSDENHVSRHNYLSDDDAYNDTAMELLDDQPRFLDLLHRKDSASSRVYDILRSTAEMGSNWILWKKLEGPVEALYKQKVLTPEMYESIKRYLLSADSDPISNPFVDRSIGSNIAKKMRSEIYHQVQLKAMAYDVPMDCEEHSKKIKVDMSILVEDKSDTPIEQLDKSNSERIDKVMKQEENIDKNVQDELPGGKFAEVEKQKKTDSAIHSTPMVHPRISKYTSPNEKYADVEQTSRLDPVTINLTIGLLLSQLSIERVKILKENEQGFDNMQEFAALNRVHEGILGYFETIISSIWHKGGDRAKGHGLDSEMPNAPLLKSVLMRQSYTANSGAIGIIEDEPDFESTQIKEVAEELVNFGTEVLGNPRILPFPEIQVTTGIATIASAIPCYAADIISRPCSQDNLDYQTPFDLMRVALEEMERRGDITRTGESSNSMQTSSISSTYLIEALEKAANIFQQCLECTSENIDYFSWHVAARTGILCVSSGIVLGEGPQLAAPPDYVYQNDLPGFSSSNSRRSRDSDYSNHRAKASKAYQDFLLSPSTPDQRGNRFHFAIKSFLEWKEAVFLLACRPHLNHKRLKRACRLHASHTFHWAQKEGSMNALQAVQHLYRKKQIHHDGLLSMLATMVEGSASNVKLWNHLANALGPVGRKDKKGKCGTTCCLECRRLRKGISINHRHTKRREKEIWWGTTPQKWWSESFFSCPTFPLSKLERRVLEFISKHIDHSDENPEKRDSSGVHAKHDLFMDVSWMWPTEPSEIDEEDHIDAVSDDGSDNSMKRPFENMVPQCPRTDSNDFDIEGLTVATGADGSHNDSLVDILASKVVVACHLYSICHPFVEKAVWYLARKNVGLNGVIPYVGKESNALEKLNWLSSLGLDVNTIIYDILNPQNDSRYVVSTAPAPPSSSSTSKYSVEAVKARSATDGSVLPVTPPKRTKDGLFMRPSGRQRKGMDWDEVDGKWIPQERVE